MDTSCQLQHSTKNALNIKPALDQYVMVRGKSLEWEFLPTSAASDTLRPVYTKRTTHDATVVGCCLFRVDWP